MEIVGFFLNFLSSYDFLVSYLSALFSREGAALILSFLSSQGVVNFYTFFLFFYLGVLTYDFVIFKFISRSRFFNKIIKFLDRKRGVKKIRKELNHFMKNNLFFSMILAKFLYGARITILLLLGREKSNFPRIFFYDILLTFVWLSIISSIGWFAGKQFDSVMDTFKNFELTISIFVLIFVLYYILKIFISKRIIKKLGNIIPKINLIYKRKFFSSIIKDYNSKK